MNRQRSYYEIALTHRQIVTVFAVVLVCLVGAFLAGVWVGGGGEGPEFGGGQQADVGGAGEELPAEELHFFTAGDKPAAEAAPEPRPAVPEAAPGTTLLEDATGGGAEPPRRREARRPATEGESAPGDLVIQVFSSNDRDQAEQLVGRLRSASHPAYLSPVDVAGRTMYRVRVGPFVERTEAETVANRVRRSFKLDTWITSKDA